jgi:formylglycine-generating enzyme required for sulfatase activity
MISRRSFLAAASLFLHACVSTDSGTTSPEFRDCDVCPTMVEIPIGDFVMGSEDGEEGRPEGPVHEVSIKRQFALARTETTAAEFRAFVDATGYQPERECRTLIAGSWANSLDYDWTSPGATIAYSEDSPVVCVSWRDAVAYTNWLSEISSFNYRLPSESEWAYAARGGSDSVYFWGNDPALGCDYANLYDQSSALTMTFSWAAAACNDGHETLAPVGEYTANPFGLYDILGNVWEWTADCYIAPYPTRTDPQQPISSQDGACERRSVRGGGWLTRPDRQRLTFRGRDPEDTRMSYFGFRVARTLSLGE